MKTIQRQPKLGLVIEDDVEKWVIESLVHKIVARLNLPTEIKLGSICYRPRSMRENGLGLDRLFDGRSRHKCASA
jgi:hypothetical protein